MAKRRELPPGPEPEGRNLPHNLEAERSILGTIMVHPSALDSIGPLHWKEFYRHAHGLIYKGMQRLHEKSVAIDLVTLRDDLRGRGDLEECGGPAYITALANGAMRTTNIKYYVDIVKEHAVLRGIVDLGNKLVARAYASDEPSALILTDADRGVVDLQSGLATGEGLIALADSTNDILADLEYRATHRGELRGFDTGFASVNASTSGWQRGDLVIVAARPSMGKTVLLSNTIVSAARAGARCAIFSLEMRKIQLHYRMISAMSGIPKERLVSGTVMAQEYAKLAEAVSEAGSLKISIQDTASMSAWDIRAACRRMRAEGGLDIVGIDYVQLMRGTIERRGATRTEEIGDISRRLKVMAGELGVCVILLSQLRRGEGRPKLSDLRESGSLEQDADVVGLLHRKTHRAGGLTEFIMEKQRDGPTGTVNLSLDRDTQLFTDAGEATPEDLAQIENEEKATDNKKRKQGYAKRAHSS